jgi:DNA repair exonuclease SbcCD ATPase subunit
MKFTSNIFLFSLFFWSGSLFLSGQTSFDSTILLRNKTFTDYRLLEEASTIRPWVNCAELTAKAKELIDIDNTLINYYLLKEIEINKSLEDKLEKLNLEIALIKKESELQEKALEENRQLINILLIVTGSLCLLFVISSIFFIDRQIRYRSIKLELERTWPIREEINKDSSFQQDVVQLNKKLGELTLKNSSLISEMQDLKQKYREKEEDLEQEILSKKKIEEEIKKLIIQIKSQ